MKKSTSADTHTHTCVNSAYANNLRAFHLQARRLSMMSEIEIKNLNIA